MLLDEIEEFIAEWEASARGKMRPSKANPYPLFTPPQTVELGPQTLAAIQAMLDGVSWPRSIMLPSDKPTVIEAEKQ